MSNYKTKCEKLRSKLLKHKEEIIDVLVKFETRMMVEDEFLRAIDLLDNIDLQKKYLLHKYNSMISSFLPLNQPLYSFLLYVFVPSLIMKTIYYRPPADQQDLHMKLFHLLINDDYGIILCCVSRKQFIEDYVSMCKIVIFTGKYDNVLELKNMISSETSIIFNGSALNPVVIGETADIIQATQDTVLARLYNSGQDCMAPACIFIHNNRKREFLQCLTDYLNRIIVGDNSNPNTMVGKLISKESLLEFIKIKEEYKEYLYYGGRYDEQQQIIQPSVFFFEEVRETIQNIYFAPIFIVMSYSSPAEIKRYLSTDYSTLYAGYISYYGNVDIKSYYNTDQIHLIALDSKTLFSFENGNSEFGGYGKGCSFIYTHNLISAQPILVSREICKISPDTE